MNEKYTASVYCSEEQIAQKTGDNVDELHTWMLIQVNGHFGDVHGEIIDNTTMKIVRAFKKSAIE